MAEKPVLGAVELKNTMMFSHSKRKTRSVFSLDLPDVKIPFHVIDPRDIRALEREMKAPHVKGGDRKGRKRKGITIRVLRRWFEPMKIMRDAQAAGKIFIQIPKVAPSQEPKVNQIRGPNCSVATIVTDLHVKYMSDTSIWRKEANV